jgi:hypothetical protein
VRLQYSESELRFLEKNAPRIATHQDAIPGWVLPLANQIFSAAAKSKREEAAAAAAAAARFPVGLTENVSQMLGALL